MRNSKLQEVVACLSRKERKKLLQFVQSPYFNNRSNAEQLLEFLEIILKHKANPQAVALRKDRLQAHFFPSTPYEPKAKNDIDNLASALNKLVEKFVIYENLQEEINRKSTLGLARFFEKHGNVSRFWPLIQKYRKSWSNNERRSSQDYFIRAQVEELAAAFAGSYDPKSKLSNIQDVDNYLNKGFFTKKLELAIILSYSALYGHRSDEQDNQFSDYVEQTYPNYQTVHTVLADIYFLALQVFHHPEDDELFARFEQMIQEKEPYIPEKEIGNIQTFYRYFFGRHYKLSGDTSLSARLVELYKAHLDKGYFFYAGDKMYIGTLKLLVNFGIKVRELDWIADLLQTISPAKILGTKYPEEIHSLCTAELHFAQQEYGKAEKLIIYRLFEDFNFSLSCDILLIKIYFETRDDLLESRLRAMELKVRRATILEFDKKAYLHFISAVRQIERDKWLKNQEKLDELLEKVQSDIPLIQREWLQKIILA